MSRQVVVPALGAACSAALTVWALVEGLGLFAALPTLSAVCLMQAARIEWQASKRYAALKQTAQPATPPTSPQPSTPSGRRPEPHRG